MPHPTMKAKKPRLSRTIWVVIFLLAALLAPELTTWRGPFWHAQQDSALRTASACASQFKTYLEKIDRLGYFFEAPRRGFPITDNRIAPQLQLQYVLVPKVLDYRPEQLDQYAWVVGYFTNEKIASSLAGAIAPQLGLQVVETCQNYILFHRST